MKCHEGNYILLYPFLASSYIYITTPLSLKSSLQNVSNKQQRQASKYFFFLFRPLLRPNT